MVTQPRRKFSGKIYVQSGSVGSKRWVVKIKKENLKKGILTRVTHPRKGEWVFWERE